MSPAIHSQWTSSLIDYIGQHLTSLCLLVQAALENSREILTLHLRKFGSIFFFEVHLAPYFISFSTWSGWHTWFLTLNLILKHFIFFTSLNNNNGPFLRTSYMPSLSCIILLRAHSMMDSMCCISLHRVMRVSGFSVWSKSICGSRHLNPGHLNSRAWACYPLLHLFKAVSLSPSLFLNSVRKYLCSPSPGFWHTEKNHRAVKQ